MRQRFPTYPVEKARKATRQQKAASEDTSTGRWDLMDGDALHSMKAGIRPERGRKGVALD